MTRILQIIPTLELGGAEKQLALMSCGLKQRGWDMHVCCLTRGGPRETELRAAKVPVSIIGKRWKIDPLALIRLQRYVAELQPDIVHTWLFAANCYGRQAAIGARVPHILANERCIDPWKSVVHFALDRYYAQYTEKIVTNSSGVIKFYRQHGFDPTRFVTIPNGLDSVSHTPCIAAREKFLETLGLPKQAKLIGTVGRLWPQKRIKDLIWAFDLLQCVQDDIFFLIVGDGPQRWRLERFNRQVTPNQHIQFLGERNDVAEIVSHLDCFWLASEYEGQSNALMEAMAAGIPVVATDIVGNRELVVSNESGVLVAVGDRAGFAARTREILQDVAFAQRLGQAAQNRIANQFSLEKMLDGYESLYRSLLAET